MVRSIRLFLEFRKVCAHHVILDLKNLCHEIDCRKEERPDKHGVIFKPRYRPKASELK